MDKDKLPRRKREKLQRRSEILEIALELFADRGFHNVSMHEIAEAAEFATGTLYKFFPSKEDLYRVLILERCSQFHDLITKSLECSGSETEKLRSYIMNKCQALRKDLKFVRLYLAESRGVSFTIDHGKYPEVKGKYNETLERLASIFESGISKGLFSSIAEPLSLAVALDSTINSLLLLWYESPERCAFPEDPDSILNIFLLGLNKQ